MGSEYYALPQGDSLDSQRWAAVVDGVELLLHPMVALARGCPTPACKLHPYAECALVPGDIAPAPGGGKVMHPATEMITALCWG